MADLEKIDSASVVRVSWSLLGEWWCVDIAAPPDEIAETIAASTEFPADLVADRLFGGFRCAEDDDRRHIHYAAGHFCYSNPECNTLLKPHERHGVWDELIELNKGKNGRFVGGGPFADDAPEQQSEEPQ